jgi:hypothetical protein
MGSTDSEDIKRHYFQGQRNPLLYKTASISDEYERVNKGVSLDKIVFLHGRGIQAQQSLKRE